MFPYWLLFTLFALGALTTSSPDQARRRSQAYLLFGAIVVIIMIGLRYRVGGDWGSYADRFRMAGIGDLGSVLAQGDPGYQFLNWLVQLIGGEIWAVNLVCGLLFGWGLHRFASVQPSPWLAYVVAVPYLIIVVAMGYTRQAAAIGILMAGLASFLRGTPALKFALFVAAAALFHRTAVVALPLVILSGERNRFLNLLGGVATFILLYDTLIASDVDRYVEGYLEAEYSSQGAMIRVAMSLVPALLFLAMPRRFGFTDRERKLWRIFAFAVIACLVAMFLSPSTTAVDRIALYLMPIQLAVFSRFAWATRTGVYGVLLVIAYSAAIQFTWLNYAAHADSWIPYRIYPLWR